MMNINEHRSGSIAIEVWLGRLMSVLIVVFMGIGALGCGAPTGPTSARTVESLGTRLQFGQHELFFTPGVEPDAAQKVGEFLVREKYLADRRASVQVRYIDRCYEIRFVVRAGAESSTPARGWRELGEKISKEIFRSSPVDIHLCDEQFNALRIIPHEPIRPELPVRVTYRPSAGGTSMVAQYRNDSAKYLSIAVDLENPTLHKSKTITLNIGPNGVIEDGWAQGWAYKSGDTIKINHADYERKDLVVP